MKIVTVQGTCTQTVINTLKRIRIDASVTVVDSKKDAFSIEFDRLILLGGTDISCWLYGQRNTHSQDPNRERDSIEWVLARRALQTQTPTMGICRGLQMITAAAGGSLFQDVQEAGFAAHQRGDHTIKPSGKLAKVIPTTIVNSYHHQAVNHVPYGFEVVARSSGDKCIEAIYRPECALGVQWHPEMLVTNDRRWEDLFKWFVDGLK